MTTTLESPIEQPVTAERAYAAYARPARTDVYVNDPRRKSVLLASVLSAVPGIGQIYVGYYQQGFTNILVICGLFALGALDVWQGGLEAGGRHLRRVLLDLQRGRRRTPRQPLQPGAGRAPTDGAAGRCEGPGLAGLVRRRHRPHRRRRGALRAHPLRRAARWLREWWPLGLVGVGIWLIHEHRRTAALGRDAD